MDRFKANQHRVSDDQAAAPAKQMFQRMLVGWAHDCLAGPRTIDWREPDPIEDYQNNDWSLLYQGSVLDD